jgi:hypothetical protein
MAPNKLQKQIATLESNIHSGAVKTTYKTPNAIRNDLLTYKIKNQLTQPSLLTGWGSTRHPLFISSLTATKTR